MFLLQYFCFMLFLEKSYADYKGAVAEHTTFVGAPGDSPASILSKNLELYEGLISLAALHQAQILVFPEFGLTPDTSSRAALLPYAEVIPEMEELKTPCVDPSFTDRPMLTRMSCAARANNITVLVNTVDYVSCDKILDPSCPDDGHYQYNTDVLFDEKGVLAAKYHKSHEWPSLMVAYDQPLVPSQITYKSSFGVEFGLFICFDIMFEDPPKVLRSRGIEHFLYAVAQGSLGESTIIEPWSKENRATLLSANLGSGKKDCSGIISNGVTLQADKFYLDAGSYPSFKDENVLIAHVSS